MISDTLAHYSDTCPHLECDGLVRVLSKVLTDKGVPHTTYGGHIRHLPSDRRTDPHFWIALPNGSLIDYRARMWLGEGDDIPHGLFAPKDYPNVEYTGRLVDMGDLSKDLFKVLITPVPEDVIRKLLEGENDV